MRIKLKNFAALSSFDSDFAVGLNAVIGENGKGKSTLVDALYFALTGDSIRGFKNEEMITWGEQDCSVTLWLDDIEIVRSINKNGNASVKFIRGATTLTRKTEVDEAILSHFGITDKSAFRQVFFAEQFKAVEILSATDAERRKMLSTLFGFGRLEKVRSTILELTNAVYTDEVSKELMDSLNDRLKSAIERSEKARQEASEVAVNILSSEALSQIKAVAQARPVAVLDELRSKLAEAEDSVKRIESAIVNLPEAPSKQDSIEYGYCLNYRQLLPQMAKAEEEIEEFGTPVVPSCEAISKQIVEKATDYAKASQMIADLNSKKQLIAGGYCPVTKGVPCADLLAMTDSRTIDGEIAQLMSIQEHIMTDKSLLEQTFKDHQQLEIKQAEVRANYNKIREMLMPLQPYAEFDCESYEQRLKAYQDSEAERNKYLEQLGNQRQTVMRYRTEIAEAEQAGVYEQSEIDKASDILRVHENAVARMPDLTRAADEADTIVSESKRSLEAAESQNRRAAKGKEIVRILNKVRTLLHNDNLPRMLVNDALNTLNTAMAKQLEEFGFLYNVKWLPGGVLVFENEIGDDVPVRSLSGGQQYVVLIALRCALVQMLGSKFPLFVLDEPTTGLDEKNREALARVLPVIGEALSSYVSTVVVPTHDEALLGTANLIKIED